MLPPPVSDVFAHLARTAEMLGSPFTARVSRTLSEILDDTTQTGRRLIAWPSDPHADLVATRLCGGYHSLVLSGADEVLAAAYPPNDVPDRHLAAALRGATVRHDDFLHDWLSSPPQTNEIGRSGMLLPGFLTIARETGLPLTLCEIGASAGLNLYFDRFGYTYGNAKWGDWGSPVQLNPEVRGAAPSLDGDLSVASRVACDIAPVDIASEAGRLRLRSYVWADQPARLARLDGALALAAKEPIKVAKADAADFVREQLETRRAGTAFVVFHSIMWQYMPRETKYAVLEALEEAALTATADAPVARLRMEPLDPSDAWATLSLTTWPGGETRRLAKCDYHGRWIEMSQQS